MSENDELDGAETDENEVEAHGLKEAAVTGLSAAALIAGAGAGAGGALAATSPGHASANAKQAVHKVDAAIKGAAANKGATFKGNSVIKLSVSKESVDPSSRRGRDAS